MKYYLAVDIGASSGRHIVGSEQNGELVLDEVYRFPNGQDDLDGKLVWDMERLFKEVKSGIAEAVKKYGKIESMSIDTWGVDYVLMRGDEEVLPAYAYRDSRTDESSEAVHAIIPHSELYARTGTQFNKFNTVYQLYADKTAGRLEGVTDILYVPQYLSYRLTGVKSHEFTDASTSGLVNKDTLEYDGYIFDKLGLPRSLMAPLRQPGESLGGFLPEVIAEIGADIEVVLCASHDTGSAVEAIDMDMNAPYISSGTWSLLGVKTEKAITDERSRTSGYSNEGGVGYNRYQKNINGLWTVQSLRRENCPDMHYDDIADRAEKSKFMGIYDINDDAFTAPKSMTEAIKNYFLVRNEEAPKDAWDCFNAAYRSLAAGYKEAIDDLEFNTGCHYSGIFIVGGGAKCDYLNRLSESFTGKRVTALPIEATAIGNLKVQMKRKA